MFSFRKRKFTKDTPKEKTLTKADLGLFYTLLNKLNPISRNSRTNNKRF